MGHAFYGLSYWQLRSLTPGIRTIDTWRHPWQLVPWQPALWLQFSTQNFKPAFFTENRKNQSLPEIVGTKLGPWARWFSANRFKGVAPILASLQLCDQFEFRKMQLQLKLREGKKKFGMYKWMDDQNFFLKETFKKGCRSKNRDKTGVSLKKLKYL